jgi:hypothetical protein
MRNYSKVGGKPGKPGYRTPSSFRSQKNIKATRIKSRKKVEKAYGKEA